MHNKTSEKNAIDLSKYVYTSSIGVHIAKERMLYGETWAETQFKLQSKKLRMPTIHEFKEFLKYLKNDYPNRAEADSILDDILTIRGPWRAEWPDARFEEKNGILHISYGHKVQGTQLVAQCSMPLEACLMKDKTPGIDLEDWLNNSTSQGLPKQDIKNGTLYYWSPRENNVARFIADMTWAYIDCDRKQEDTYGSLGVFACIEPTKRDD